MANDFKIEVPINVKGGDSGGIGSNIAVKKELEKLNRNTVKLNKTMFLNIDVIEILSSLVGDLFKILQPLFKLLSLMLVLIFLPLMPIYKTLIKALGSLAKVIAKITRPGDASGFVEEKGRGVAAIVAGILIAIGAGILFAMGGWIVVLLGAVTAIIVTFWEEIAGFFVNAWTNYVLPAFQWIGNQIMNLWETVILPPWNFLKNVGVWIWQQVILPAFSFLKNVGSWIWGIISAPFIWLAGRIKSIWDFFSGFGKKVGGILGFEKGGVVPGSKGSAQMAIVHGGETIIPAGKGGGSVVININNPTVRQSSDIKSIANEVSKVLQRQMSGRISPG